MAEQLRSIYDTLSLAECQEMFAAGIYRSHRPLNRWLRATNRSYYSLFISSNPGILAPTLGTYQSGINVTLGEGVGVMLGVSVIVGVDVSVGGDVGEGVRGVGVKVFVGGGMYGVGVFVGVSAGVGVSVTDLVGLGVGVSLGVGVIVGVGVGGAPQISNWVMSSVLKWLPGESLSSAFTTSVCIPSLKKPVPLQSVASQVWHGSRTLRV